MNRIKKGLLSVVLLLCFICSGTQIGWAQNIDSPSTGGIHFKVNDNPTSESTDTNKPSDNDSNNQSNNSGNDPEKDLSKNSVDSIPSNRIEKSGVLPKMGELAGRIVPILGIGVVIFVLYIFIKKRNEKKV